MTKIITPGGYETDVLDADELVDASEDAAESND